MDKIVLVLLLCLQALLLTTALDSDKAATLLTDNRQLIKERGTPRIRPPYRLPGRFSLIGSVRPRIPRRSYCYRRPGACSLLPRPNQDRNKTEVAHA
nr:uncharacterized protein LOC125984529 isoform X3 [Syngnathus scovelli]